MADENENENEAELSTICSDTSFYCEYQCNSGTWELTNENHGPNYYCSSTLPLLCSGSDTTCATPLPKPGGSSQAIRSTREVALNTGDYLFDGKQLHLLHGRTDTKHFCPPTLSLDDIKHLPIASALEQLAKDESFVSVIANIPANPTN